MKKFGNIIYIFLFIIFNVTQKILACPLLVPPEYLNGCTYDIVNLVVPNTEFLIDRSNCNDVIPKDTFEEKPFVYFSNADVVRIQSAPKIINCAI